MREKKFSHQPVFRKETKRGEEASSSPPPQRKNERKGGGKSPTKSKARSRAERRGVRRLGADPGEKKGRVKRGKKKALTRTFHTRKTKIQKSCAAPAKRLKKKKRGGDSGTAATTVALVGVFKQGGAPNTGKRGEELGKS